MCTCVLVMCVCTYICKSMSLCARLSLVSVCGRGIRDLATHVDYVFYHISSSLVALKMHF